MTYFVNVSSYENLKSQYRKLAIANHPDTGGKTDVMQAINKEYDQLFIVWKHRENITANETAASTRSEFYTQNGWKGENYNSKLSLKEIACIIREFIKIHYNDCKFSVTTEYASMCQELHIALLESPYRAYKTFDELTEEENTYDCEYSAVIRKYTQFKNIGSWYKEELNNIIRPMYDKDFGAEEGIYFPSFQTEEIKKITKAVEEYANSFNYDDSDGQIDYFDNNFYFFGVKIGKWNKPYRVVERAKKSVPNVEYENVEVIKTRTYKTLEAKDIDTPVAFKQGQLFQLKSNFNYGCRKGYVYRIDDVRHGMYVNAYKMGKGYKNICKGQTPGNSFCLTFEKLKGWIEKSAISFVELVEVTKTEEYKSVVRRPKKQTGLSTNVNEKDSNNANETNTETEQTITNNKYTVTEDVDTRDNSPLWVVKFINRLSKEEYVAVSKQLKKLKGHYSRFKSGFIFRYDPTEELIVLERRKANVSFA